MYLSQLHEMAGVEWPDEALIETAVADVYAELELLVSDLHRDPYRKAMVLSAWLAEKEDAASEATLTAGMAG